MSSHRYRTYDVGIPVLLKEDEPDPPYLCPECLSDKVIKALVWNVAVQPNNMSPSHAYPIAYLTCPYCNYFAMQRNVGENA